ncbi:TRAP transporter substrate-binding protein [Sulfurovum sp.]|uniref:TRAP transporter substrate-binding protein n=1 Tax=Sulfurovum sp. TaxID=1969726 RepID=UPI0028681A43|nr:TRAP transporter substrate-binding protein [Sulfurovum sp.]
MRIFKLAYIAMFVTFLTGSLNASDKKVITWKLAQTWGSGMPIFGDAVINMAERVKKMSDGRFIIKIDSANKHKAPLGIYDFVKSGRYQMGHSASYYWKGKDMNTMFFSTVPFGMIAQEQYAWFYYGGGMELAQEVYGKHGMMSFPGGNTGNQMGGWFRKEMKTVEDFKGLKMRIPGFAGEVLSKLGASVVNIAPGELYTALDRGTIDALEWVGPALDLKMGFHKVAPYYYTGWHEPATELQFLVNEKAFNELPADLQEILKEAMKSSAYDMLSQSMHENAESLATIKKDYPNVQIKTFSKEIMTRIEAENDKLLIELSEKDPMTKKIIDHQKAYLKKVRDWTNISDFAYLKSY